jgi:hypothetical protein
LPAVALPHSCDAEVCVLDAVALAGTSSAIGEPVAFSTMRVRTRCKQRPHHYTALGPSLMH